MTRKIFLFSSLFLAFLLARPAAAQTAVAVNVDELVARNLQARGGAEALKGIQTLKMTARFMNLGMEMPMTTYGKRPNLTRKELTITGQKIVFVFDGDKAWQINPLQGSPSAVDITGPELAMIRQESDFDSPFVDYKARGFTITFVGTETIDGRQLHHLKVTRNGVTQDCYLDATTGLEARTVNQSPMGQLVQEFLDYRPVQGIQMPFIVRTLQNGARVAEIKFDAVEINGPVDDSLFQKPKS
jgi:outer membrane lipoprotein-sorting protein